MIALPINSRNELQIVKVENMMRMLDKLVSKILQKDSIIRELTNVNDTLNKTLNEIRKDLK